VSIGSGTIIENSEIRDSIIGLGCSIARCKLEQSLIGDEVLVQGVTGQVSLGSHCEVRRS
jgi:ADP-glucose pyrophosphorylase